ncbi:MAG: hypothetical protein V9E96_16425 [Chitinophagaceae bacterium]
MKPVFLHRILEQQHFVYANVPYKIKSYEAIVNNPKDTIEYAHENEKNIHARVESIGADGALLTIKSGEIYRVNFIEKILATTLAKLSNFIPEAGIWMNTQRPEWNDANNALVGNGVSMVTLYYLRRFLSFLDQALAKSITQQVEISEEVSNFFKAISNTFTQNISVLDNVISNTKRKEITDALGIAGSNFRNQVYLHSFSGKKATLDVKELINFLHVALQFVDHSIKANKRNDNLYHAYNLLSFDQDQLKITHLSEMLEGQVAVLSAGFLTADESVQVLDALKVSSLYRADQNSYILYPNKQLPKFLEKNNIPSSAINKSLLLKKLLSNGNSVIVEKDILGSYHFNGNFKNADDLANGLDNLSNDYSDLVKKDKALVIDIFEEVFNHKEFTGRSGTFFGYEGLGSIYWHMVSKLAVAVQETCLTALENNASKEVVQKLVQHYYHVIDGIGVHKSPTVYGAFPVTPYSHTPLNKGAQQPGMTGQVKEDILTRIGELGVQMKDGQLSFNPQILAKKEFLQIDTTANFVMVDGSIQKISLAKNSLAFTVCQVPVIYQLGNIEKIKVTYTNATEDEFDGTLLNKNISHELFNRTGTIAFITVIINEISLR